MTAESPSKVRTHRLPYGCDAQLELRLDADRVMAVCGEIVGDAERAPRAATASALKTPIDFPPLNEATVPGDRVVIAVDRGVPQAPEIVAGIVDTLTSGRIDPADVRVVVANGFVGAEQINRLLRDKIGRTIDVEQHDAGDSDQLCYLAASGDAKPIYFNRAMCEADIVIPVGCLRTEGTLSYLDDAMGVFPTFADEATICRFRAPSSWLSPANRDRHRAEAREAAYLLGVSFTVQVVPAGGDAVFRVLAGGRDAVFAAGRELISNTWMCDVPARASLVVAAVSGGPEQQTWDSFARALFASLQIVQDGGAIVVCSDLDQQPGAAMMRIRGVDPDAVSDLAQIGHDIFEDSAEGAMSASQLVEALRRVRVYLLSQLDDGLVEDLGLAVVSCQEEVVNLCSRHPSCILVANSQHVLPTLKID